MSKGKKILILILNWLIILAFIMCYGMYCNAIIAPSVFPYFGLLALVFPIAYTLLLLLIFIRLFFVGIKKSILYTILMIPLCFSFSNIYKFGFSEPKKEGIKLMTYNVKYGKDGFDALKKYIEDSESEIVFLQEIYQRHWRKEVFLPNHYNAVHDYVGISSKYPIVYSAQVKLHDTNGFACMADIAVGNDTIRAFNVYLGSIYLTKVLTDLTQSNDVERNTVIAKNKLLQGYKNHEKELKTLINHFNESPYPIIVGGDFNAVPMSYEYYQMKKYLNDAFATDSKGWATTYGNYKFPIRIDYLWVSDDFTTSNYTVDRSAHFSDHSPVFSFINFKNTKE